MEQKIIKEALKGNREAFNWLYSSYKRLWYSLCLRYQSNSDDAADVLQNGLIKIYTQLYTYDPSKGDFKSWSCKLMVNENLIFIRARPWDKNKVDEEEMLSVPDVADHPVDTLSAEELTGMIRSLPVGYRTVFNLYVLEGYTHNEISKQLNISEGTSKSQLSKAKKMLRQLLEQQLNVFKYED